MQRTDRTAKEHWFAWRDSGRITPFGWGSRPCLLNIDLQRRYTDMATFDSAYEADPQQLPKVNAIAQRIRALGLPVIWTYVAYLPGGVDAGLWSVRSKSPMAIQNVGHDSAQAEIDARLHVDAARDLMLHKRMASAFFETHLVSFLIWNRIDTVILTGGATSGCVRASAVDSMSYGFRTIVAEDCVADREEGAHYGSLYDMTQKCADVLPAHVILGKLQTIGGAAA